MHTIGFIPARGGSQRIPRKNLRTVGGIPLVARTIRVLQAAGIDDVIVSTEDAEIADVAVLWGARVDLRPAHMAGAEVTIAQLVDDWMQRTNDAAALTVVDGAIHKTMIVVAQPTSPLLRPTTVADAVEHAAKTGETVFTVAAERHMIYDESMRLVNRERVNSTHAVDASVFRETGALVVFDYEHRSPGDVEWPPIPRTCLVHDTLAEGIDVDDYGDLVRARAGAKPAYVQFRYAESIEIGSGHRRRCETLAIELAGHHQVEVVDHSKSPVVAVTTGMSVDARVEVPDVVVLDILDTRVEDVQSLYDMGVQYVVTLEDRGLGASLADLTVNELYTPSSKSILRTHERCGPKYAVLRPEFQGHGFTERPRLGVSLGTDRGATVVATFGGTDPTQATEAVVAALGPISTITKLRIIVPPGRALTKQPIAKPHEWKRSVPIEWDVLLQPCMAAEFLNAHLVVSSSGRTVHEAAACGVPVIACAVNERERLHTVCPGVTYLPNLDGVGFAVAQALRHYATSDSMVPAVESARLAHAAVDGLGGQRIAWLIDGLLGGLL